MSSKLYDELEILFALDNELFPLPLGYGFSVKEFVEPFAILKICIKKRDPHMAVRYKHYYYFL